MLINQIPKKTREFDNAFLVKFYQISPLLMIIHHYSIKHLVLAYKPPPNFIPSPEYYNI